MLLSMACKPEIKPWPYTTINGNTMGTYYRCIYQDSAQRNFSLVADSLLIAINKDVNNWDSTSTVSRWNQSTAGFTIDTVQQFHFYKNMLAARDLVNISNGAFDPTVMLLVNYWGFGYKGKKPVAAVDSQHVRALLKLTGWDKVTFNGNHLGKKFPGTMIDLGGLAQGYGIDALCALFDRYGITNYYVEIGGESRGKGINTSGKPWTVGLNVPDPESKFTDVTSILQLDNLAISTSGNYRNFHEYKGVKYGHTIHPKTGFPELNRLLSATIIAPDCTTADGLATACMVLGPDEAYALIRSQKLEGVLIFSDEKGNMETRVTPGVEKMVVKYRPK